MKARTQASLLSAILALSVTVGVAQAAPPTNKNASSKSANSQSATSKTDVKTKTTSAKKEAKPVLSTETLQSIQEAAAKLDPETRKSLGLLSNSLHETDKAIYNEIRDDEEISMTDIGMLWEAAVERSGTIRYAIEKLSRRDATGKPVEADNFSKRMIGSLVHLGGVAGSMWSGTPAGLIGSNMIQDLMAGNPQESALSKVTDADMVLLAKNVEELQSQLIELYFSYKNAKEKLALSKEAEMTIGRYYDHADSQNGTTADALRPLMQSLQDSAKQDVQNALQNYNSSKSALSLLVGPDAIAALEQNESKKASTASVQ